MTKIETLWVAAVLLLFVAAGAMAGGGLAELRLDTAAVAQVLGAALPEPLRVDLPAVGEVTVTLGPVRRVRFVEGAVHADVTLEIDRLDVRETIRVRFVPDVERRSGTARLVPQEAHVTGLPIEIDLAAWIRPAVLPRSVQWDLEMPGAGTLPVRCYVQGVEVEEDRLRIDLGLVGGDADGGARNASVTNQKSR